MTLNGIDVSTWQGTINWDAVAASGIAYAWAKVSEGNGAEDPRWAQNAGPLAAPGPITAGAYHFARPDLGNTPEAEADWFWARLTARVPNVQGWLLSLDLEAGSGDLSGWRDRWCQRLSQHAGGYQPGWYTNWNFAVENGLNKATDYWGWLAWPDSNGSLPPAQFDIAFQQYGVVTVPGIGAQVDADRFFGDGGQLAALTVGGEDAMPLDPNDPVIVDLRNRLGDLLYYIDPGPPGATGQGELTVRLRNLSTPTVDVNALAAALAPHLQVVDEAKLAADLEAALPAAELAAFRTALTKALGTT